MILKTGSYLSVFLLCLSPTSRVFSCLHRQDLLFGLKPFLRPSFYLPLVVSVVFNSWLLQQPVKLSSSLSLLQAPTWKMLHFPIWVTHLEKKSHTHLTTSKAKKIEIKIKEILKRSLKALCCIYK